MPCRYGPKQQPPIYSYYDGDANLFGARKPHLPQEFTLAPDELITKVELQWDPISMRCECKHTHAHTHVSPENQPLLLLLH